MKMLSQNSKMRKSSNKDIIVYNFTLPAFKSTTGLITCPNAKACVSGCYARQGAYQFSNVKSKHEANLAATQSIDFVERMVDEISELVSKTHKDVYIRIHDAGDFYSRPYLYSWIKIMKTWEMQPRVRFYAYTKQVSMLKGQELPSNFIVIYSLGGKEDNLINPRVDRYAEVFDSEDILVKNKYINASNDDLNALTSNRKIGLVYHGTKKYENTTWKLGR